MRQARDENDRYNNSSGVVCAKLSRVFQNQSIYATTPVRAIHIRNKAHILFDSTGVND